MTPQTSSFIADVETAVLAEILSECGTGSSTYPTPEYLLLVHADRGEVVPRLEINDDLLPGLRMQYVAGQMTESGTSHYQVTREEWNIGAVIHLTSAIMGYEGNDVATFYQYAMASADTLLRRLHKTLHGFKPDVSDSLLGGATGTGRVGRWGIVPNRIGDFDWMFTAMLEFAVQKS